MQIRVKENAKEFGTCGCGRSPTGKCLGLHALTEDEWIGGKTQILANIAMGRGKIGIEKPMGEPGDELV
jgi:hypothetical protein